MSGSNYLNLSLNYGSFILQVLVALSYQPLSHLAAQPLSFIAITSVFQDRGNVIYLMTVTTELMNNFVVRKPFV